MSTIFNNLADSARMITILLEITLMRLGRLLHGAGVLLIVALLASLGYMFWFMASEKSGVAKLSDTQVAQAEMIVDVLRSEVRAGDLLLLGSRLAVVQSAQDGEEWAKVITYRAVDNGMGTLRIPASGDDKRLMYPMLLGTRVIRQTDPDYTLYRDRYAELARSRLR